MNPTRSYGVMLGFFVFILCAAPSGAQDSSFYTGDAQPGQSYTTDMLTLAASSSPSTDPAQGHSVTAQYLNAKRDPPRVHIFYYPHDSRLFKEPAPSSLIWPKP